MAQRISDLMASQAQQAFIGRCAEMELLRTMLSAQGPRVAHVHGIAGIGKTALLERFATEARGSGATVIQLDCRGIEPTESGLLKALGDAIGRVPTDAMALADRLGGLGETVVITFDTFEVFRLLDSFLRQVFVPSLPDNVRVVFLGREPPGAPWLAMPGWGSLLLSVPMSPLSTDEAAELLVRLGSEPEVAQRIARLTHGHPLALRLAAEAVREQPEGPLLRDSSLLHVLDELTRTFLADVGDPVTRRVLEGVALTRRATVSLLRVLFPDLAPQDAYQRLRSLPFVDVAEDGLIVHDAVRDPIARSLHASDPSRHLEYRRTAWRQLTSEAETAGSTDLWRYTADMLYLIENPVVREAFFPSDTAEYTVELARPEDHSALMDITRAHEGDTTAGAIKRWLQRLPQCFSVVRDQHGEVAGFCCKLRSDQVEPAWLLEDPITEQWFEHLRHRPMPRGEIALFCRRWLSREEGELPSAPQAAAWIDLKRTYMELRPRLRRVYLTVRDLPAYQSVALRLGFEVLEDHQATMDGLVYHSAVLDFGPSSVDGWLADLAAAELGVERPRQLLDTEARELVLDEGRVALTPLEFGVMHHLELRQGKAVSRSDLLRDVWGTTYEGGSNVVDAVVRTLRRKLGPQARRIETVTGVGYRLKS
ncbi:winged helix-turn-helix domain-containing protein [Marinobacter zhanjiangensis]|uniref:OmpR/PhoB-type domain-containing protein n=1 Tax=Marinobacter zhanjiangensis TaxID=578215 RepID=A0ABQ3ARY1_9GAMM|nr:winged helix-turn-helix domain-containing protein [Marinobacter zhanjiangensis]GGY62112.1 hypothetical protein GCM10007071_06230 [Marinobacter zhanjiangensis]